MIATLVVEDEPRIAEAHCAYLRRLPRFRVAGAVGTGRDALRFLAGAGSSSAGDPDTLGDPVDLVLLDLYLPDMGGLDVARAMRAAGHAVDVIAVTSARDLDVVRAAVSQGVVQYLLKPFTFPAFRDKLERYADYRAHLSARGTTGAVAQDDVDRALGTLRGSSGSSVPKGLSDATLAAVIAALRAAALGLSAAEVAEIVGVSRVTARRYLEHLADSGLTASGPRYGSPGRPEHVYRWASGSPGA